MWSIWTGSTVEPSVIAVSADEDPAEEVAEVVLVSEGFVVIPQDERMIRTDSITAVIGSFLFINGIFLVLLITDTSLSFMQNYLRDFRVNSIDNEGTDAEDKVE